MKQDELRAIWDRESIKYINRPTELSKFPLPAEFLPCSGEKVLDAGCGAGNRIGMYREITSDVFALDFSILMTKSARRYGSVIIGDIHSLPFKQGEFDYVSSFLVINHVLNSRSAFAMLTTAIKPGGRLVVVVPNWFSLLAPLRFLSMKTRKYSLGLCRHYTVSMLRKEGKLYDLSIIQVYTIPKVPTDPTSLRSIPFWLAYFADQIVRFVYPVWGGDLAVMFKKKG